MADLEVVLADVSDADRDPPQIDELRQELFLQIDQLPQELFTQLAASLAIYIVSFLTSNAIWQCMNVAVSKKQTKVTKLLKATIII